MLFYVGIQMWRDPLFPYDRLDTVWIAVSLVPERVVIGTGIKLLLFALVSTAFAIGVSVLLVRGLILLGRRPAEASAVLPGRRGWMLYLLLLMPLAVVGLWSSVRVNGATELAYFIGFFVFSAAAGLVFGYVRWASTAERFYLTMVVVYLGGIAAAICLAATQTPPLPLVETRADRNVTLACKEVPTEEMFVMLDRGTHSYTSTTTKMACSAYRRAMRRPCVSVSARDTWTGTDPRSGVTNFAAILDARAARPRPSRK